MWGARLSGRWICLMPSNKIHVNWRNWGTFCFNHQGGRWRQHFPQKVGKLRPDYTTWHDTIAFHIATYHHTKVKNRIEHTVLSSAILHIDTCDKTSKLNGVKFKVIKSCGWAEVTIILCSPSTFKLYIHCRKVL